MKNFEIIRKAKGSSSLRAFKGCVAIQPSRVEELKSLKVEKLLITSQPFNLSSMFTGLLRWHRRSLKPQAEVLCIGAAQPPRNDTAGRGSFTKGCMAHGYDNSARSAHKGLIALFTYCPIALRSAFTMAEILLSLTIIGVVAAITLPSLTGNINERTWNTQKKALYARLSQAIALMPALNNYGSTDDNAAETFITNGLSKVLKINNICGYGTNGSTLFDCGLSSQIIPIGGGEKINLPKEVKSLNAGIINYNEDVSIRNTKAAAFETANGEAILTFYNPNCTAANVLISGVSGSGQPGLYTKQQVCANFVYDLNGKKGPNTLGKDIGTITVVYSSDSNVVMPLNPHVIADTKTYTAASTACKDLDDGAYRLPNIEELLAIYYNKNLIGGVAFAEASNHIWSSTAVDADKVYSFGAVKGIKYKSAKTLPYNVVCVQR